MPISASTAAPSLAVATTDHQAILPSPHGLPGAAVGEAQAILWNSFLPNAFFCPSYRGNSTIGWRRQIR